LVGSVLPNLNMKHYTISGDFIKFSECEVSLRKCKASYTENFLATVGSGLNLTPFRATVSLRSILSYLKK